LSALFLVFRAVMSRLLQNDSPRDRTDDGLRPSLTTRRCLLTSVQWLKISAPMGIDVFGASCAIRVSTTELDLPRITGPRVPV